MNSIIWKQKINSARVITQIDSNLLIPDLFIDMWKIQEVDQVDTGIIESLGEEHKMEEKDHDKYLGDIFMNNGKNTKNIAARRQKGLGVIDQIM